MQTIDILELSPQAREWLSQIEAGQELLVTAGGQPVIKITGLSGHTTEPGHTKRKHRQAGMIKGPAWMSPDFDEPLENGGPPSAKRKRRQAGTANPKGRQAGLSDDILWISPDFDEPLEEFAEYM